MFVSTLEELAGQLAALEPPQPRSFRRSSAGSKEPAADVLQRVMDRAPNAALRAYMDRTSAASRVLRQPQRWRSRQGAATAPLVCLATRRC
mgnify:CR=1 FL=1